MCSTAELVNQDKITIPNDAILMSLLSTLNMFVILIYLSVNLKRLITCRIVEPNQLPAKCFWALGSLSWTSVQANLDDKILKIFIEGSVSVWLALFFFVFAFFVVKSLFSGGPVEVKSFQHFNVSTMPASTLRYLSVSYKRNLKKWKNDNQKKRDK